MVEVESVNLLYLYRIKKIKPLLLTSLATV